VVGFTSMTFQYDSTLRLAALTKRLLPAYPHRSRGYHATLFYDQIAAGPDREYWDFSGSRRGRLHVWGLLDCIEDGGKNVDRVLGLSYRDGDRFPNPWPPLRRPDEDPTARRDKRTGIGFHMYFREG